MKLNKLILFILIISILFFPVVYSWDCYTHIILCEMNHNYYSPNPNGCCRSDIEKNPSPVLHHCEGNLSSCSARVKALEYYPNYVNVTTTTYVNTTYWNGTSNINLPNQPQTIITQVNVNNNTDMDLYWHLMDDAESSSHWFSFSSADHSKFEDCVNEQVKMGNHPWTCRLDVIDKNGIPRHLEMDNNLINWKTPSVPVVQEVVNYTQPVNNYIPEVKKGLWERFMEWLSNLFSSNKGDNKNLGSYNQTNNS